MEAWRRANSFAPEDDALIGASERSGLVRFSTDAITPSLRVAAVLALNERGVVRAKLVPAKGQVPRAVIAQRSIGPLGLLRGLLENVSQKGASDASGRNDDEHLYLAVNVAGRCIARDGEDEVDLPPGDAVLHPPGSRRFRLLRPGTSHFLGFRISRRIIAPLVGTIETTPMRAIAHDRGPLQLLTTYVSAAFEDQALENQDVCARVSTHLIDLLALTIGPTRDGLEIASARSVRPGRLLAIKRDVESNLDADVSLAAVAARHALTPRYIHKLFETEGVTYSEYVLGLRLVRAHRMLTDRRFAHRTVSEIAYATGFGDISTFNRRFRKQYGATPSEVRHATCCS